MKKEKKWLKTVLWCGIAGIPLALLLWELLGIWKIVLFFLAAGGFGLLMTHLQTGGAAKKQKQDAEIAERIQRQMIESRRALCREARYTSQERQAVEAYIEKTFDPIQAWDRDEEPKLMPIDIALIPPTGVSPYWRAVTVGVGAYVGIELGPVPHASELAILLPPDWKREDEWPMRLLRDAAQHLLVQNGWIGPSSIYRGFSVMSAGFAEAVLLEDLWNQYPLEAANLPGGGAVNFYWLFPLLKPERDYWVARDGEIEPLERRMRNIDPAADRNRVPCCNMETWLQEDIEPFCWSRDGETFCLGLDTRGYQTELFLRVGRSGSGWDWERLAKEIVSDFYPNDQAFIEYACEEWTFFAVSEDEEALRHLALKLHDLCCYEPERAVRMMIPDETAFRKR